MMCNLLTSINAGFGRSWLVFMLFLLDDWIVSGVVVHLPAHSFWLWFILVSPAVVWTALWAIAQYGRVSLKSLKPWLMAGMLLSAPAFLLLEVSDGHKTLRRAAQAIFYTCMIGSAGIDRHYSFETLRGPRAKWYLPWSAARFSIPQNARIFVRDVDSVAPWYVDKLGLRNSESPWAESGAATYRFKKDGKSITLTTKTDYGTEKTLVLLTKRIDKIKGVLSARGIEVGLIEQDRQGTRYFEIHDPDGNTIEVVEEP